MRRSRRQEIEAEPIRSIAIVDGWAYVREPCTPVQRMRIADVIPCTRCHLRGHIAGDPDRCIQPISLRLGGDQISQAINRRRGTYE